MAKQPVMGKIPKKEIKVKKKPYLKMKTKKSVQKKRGT